MIHLPNQIIDDNVGRIFFKKLHVQNKQKYNEKSREVKKLISKEIKNHWEKICIQIDQYLAVTRSWESWKILKSLRTNRKKKLNTDNTGRLWIILQKSTNIITSRISKVNWNKKNAKTGGNLCVKDEVRKAITTLKNNSSHQDLELIKYGYEKLFS